MRMVCPPTSVKFSDPSLHDSNPTLEASKIISLANACFLFLHFLLPTNGPRRQQPADLSEGV